MQFPYVQPCLVRPQLRDEEDEWMVKIEEVIRYFFFLAIACYLVCHILFFPLEFVLYAFFQDPSLQDGLSNFYRHLVVKYGCCAVMLYSAYHHTDLRQHNNYLLWAFGIGCGIAAYHHWRILARIEDILMRFTGRGVENHPFLYDFVGFTICAVLGTAYIIYISTTEIPGPITKGYQMIPNVPFDMQLPVASEGVEMETTAERRKLRPVMHSGYQLIQLS
eukprot:TRINITY_DN760_c0_g1_i13.p1 TRINITY_DN760_c0_g1~~TRINITY_DN760_c0_g1_i13.p1  ORF type:complete len:220 (-),score=52.33 TRINITY_DN760_c0_g1_i13:92-751(-)